MGQSGAKHQAERKQDQAVAIDQTSESPPPPTIQIGYFPEKLPDEEIQKSLSKKDSPAKIHLKSFLATKNRVLFEGQRNTSGISISTLLSDNRETYYLGIHNLQPTFKKFHCPRWYYEKQSDGFYCIFFTDRKSKKRRVLHCPTLMTQKGKEGMKLRITAFLTLKQTCPLLPSEIIKYIISLSPSKAFIQLTDIDSFDQLTFREKFVIFGNIEKGEYSYRDGMWQEEREKYFLSIDGILLKFDSFENDFLESPTFSIRNDLLQFVDKDPGDETDDEVTESSISNTEDEGMSHSSG